MSTDTKRSTNMAQKHQLMQHKRQKIIKVFLQCPDNTCSKIKLIAINSPFYEDKIVNRRLHTYWVAGYMQNLPLRLEEYKANKQMIPQEYQIMQHKRQKIKKRDDRL